MDGKTELGEKSVNWVEMVFKRQSRALAAFCYEMHRKLYVHLKGASIRIKKLDHFVRKFLAFFLIVLAAFRSDCGSKCFRYTSRENTKGKYENNKKQQQWKNKIIKDENCFVRS